MVVTDRNLGRRPTGQLAQGVAIAADPADPARGHAGAKGSAQGSRPSTACSGGTHQSLGCLRRLPLECEDGSVHLPRQARIVARPRIA